MSSRNGYLTKQERALAPLVYIAISRIKAEIELGRRDFMQMIEQENTMLAVAGFKPDYIEIRDAFTLQPAAFEAKELVVLIAAFLGKTRLIDNIQITL